MKISSFITITAISVLVAFPLSVQSAKAGRNLPEDEPTIEELERFPIRILTPEEAAMVDPPRKRKPNMPNQSQADYASRATMSGTRCWDESDGDIRYYSSKYFHNPINGCKYLPVTSFHGGTEEPGGCVTDVGTGWKFCSRNLFIRQRLATFNKQAREKGMQRGSAEHNAYVLESADWWLKEQFYPMQEDGKCDKKCVLLDR